MKNLVDNYALPVCILLSVVLCFTVSADTIYVNPNNTSPATNGLTFASGWTTISDALDHLASVNVEPDKGGYEILIGAGVYNTGFVLTADHAGVSGSPNRLGVYGDGVVLIDVMGAQQNVIYLNSTRHLVIDGFRLAGGTGRGLFSNNSPHVSLNNLLAYNNVVGIRINNSSDSTAVSNCAAVANASEGFALSFSDAVFYNCASVGNGYGFRTRHSKQPLLLNNLFYGNGIQAVVTGFGELHDADDINGVHGPLGQCAGNIVAHPGWRFLGALDLSVVYEGSPLLNAGIGGVHIGSEPVLTTVPLVFETFYVDAENGNDGNSGGQGAPWRTLARAAQAAGAGDTVYVAPGVYNGSAVFTNGTAADAPLRIIGGNGVVVDATGYANGIELHGMLDVEISGLNIRSATTRNLVFINSAGAVLKDVEATMSTHGVSFQSSPGAFASNIKAAHNSSFGISVYDSARGVFAGFSVQSNHFGMILNRSAGVTMEDGRFEHNTNHGFWTQGTSPDSLIERCTFLANAGCGLYINAISDSIDMRNCIVAGNAREGVYLRTNINTSWIRNCVIHGNGTGAVKYDGIRMETLRLNHTLTVENSVISENGRYGLNEMQADVSRIIYAHNNCFYANGEGNYYDAKSGTVKATADEINGLAYASGNIVDLPMFRDAANMNFKLMGGSPCVDAGTTTTELETDYYGNPRLVGPAVDIGIYEMPPPGMVIRMF